MIIIFIISTLFVLFILQIMNELLYKWFPLDDSHFRFWWIKHISLGTTFFYLMALLGGYNILAAFSLIIVFGSFIAGAVLRPNKNNQNIIIIKK